jgi:transcriptional regulator with XRE-family HTH domain
MYLCNFDSIIKWYWRKPMPHKDVCVKLGKRLREIRLSRGWTQEDMQERGFSYRYYGMIERGEVSPSIDTLSKIAEIFEITLNELFQFPFVEGKESQETEEVVAEILKVIQSKNQKKVRKLKIFIKEILA